MIVFISVKRFYVAILNIYSGIFLLLLRGKQKSELDEDDGEFMM